MQVNILEAKTRLSELVKSAQAGEEVIIANRGVPAVKLVKIEAKPRKPGARKYKDFVEWLEAHPIPAHMRRTKEQIDADIAEERDSWD